MLMIVNKQLSLMKRRILKKISFLRKQLLLLNIFDIYEDVLHATLSNVVLHAGKKLWLS